MTSSRLDVSDPSWLATTIDALPRRRLLVFDCDGVLAPLVAHADRSVLAPGTGDALAELAATDGTDVAILSGRSLAGLAQFGFDDHIDVLGSYGAERRGRPPTELEPDRLGLLDELTDLAAEAADRAGTGAWVETKPASVVLHVREADADAGALATRRLRDTAERLHGVFVHEGKAVVELAVHRSDKGVALAALIDEYAPASVVYLGDDDPDEAAFSMIAKRPLPGFGVRIGPVAVTAASHLLAGPAAVTELLVALGRS